MPLERLIKLNTKDCLWIYILRILLDGPSHAYVIRSEIQKRFGFKPGTVTAYRVLYKLNRKGFVKKEDRNRKRVYSVTPEGRKKLKEAVKFYRERVRFLAGK